MVIILTIDVSTILVVVCMPFLPCFPYLNKINPVRDTRAEGTYLFRGGGYEHFGLLIIILSHFFLARERRFQA